VPYIGHNLVPYIGHNLVHYIGHNLVHYIGHNLVHYIGHNHLKSITYALLVLTLLFARFLYRNVVSVASEQTFQRKKCCNACSLAPVFTEVVP
jgi:hypothetical protein